MKLNVIELINLTFVFQYFLSNQQVLERRQGVNMRVNLKEAGDCFGEVSLLYTTPRSATVAATLDSVVWVLERENFRYIASYE